MRIAIDGVYFGLLLGATTDSLIKLAVDCGAEGLNWPFHAGFDCDNVAAVASKLQAAGQPVVSLALTSHTGAAPGMQSEFREHVSRAVEASQVLGTRILDCWPRRPEEVEKSVAQATLRENLEAITPTLADGNCVLSIEFEPNTTVENYAEAVEFLAPYAPHVMITADSYHIIRIGNDLAAAATACAPQLGIIHFSASTRGECGSEGDLCDYDAFLGAALAAGYQGDLLLQYQPKGDALESLKRAMAFTHGVVGRVTA